MIMNREYSSHHPGTLVGGGNAAEGSGPVDLLAQADVGVGTEREGTPMSSTAGGQTLDAAAVLEGSAEPARAAPARYGAGFWLITFVFVTGMAFSTVPTPLYSLYQVRDGFSTFTITIVFAVYTVGVLASLLLAGHLSDLVGRRKVLLAALALELAAAVLFMAVPPLPVLIVARLTTGLGVGMLAPTATAHLQELHHAYRPGASPQRFEIVSTAANIGGLGLGPLIAGVLAQYLDAPLRLPYLVFGVLLLISVGAVALTPETVEDRAATPAYRPLRLSVGQSDTAGYVGAAAAGVASFAVFGLFTSLAPWFVGGTLHNTSHALAGLIVFAVFSAAAAAQLLSSRLDASVRRSTGLLAQAAGLALLAVGMHAVSLSLFLIGGIIASMGAGILFKSAVGAVAAIAGAATRAEALASLFLISYLGMALPALGVGVAMRYLSATVAVTWFSGVLLVLLAAVGVLSHVSMNGESRWNRPKRTTSGSASGNIRAGASGRPELPLTAMPARPAPAKLGKRQ
jgi:predicted MFS family arabinose efflux permease